MMDRRPCQPRHTHVWGLVNTYTDRETGGGGKRRAERVRDTDTNTDRHVHTHKHRQAKGAVCLCWCLTLSLSVCMSDGQPERHGGRQEAERPKE